MDEPPVLHLRIHQPAALPPSAQPPSRSATFPAARGGEVTVMVPADVADRFNKALVSLLCFLFAYLLAVCAPACFQPG